VPKIFICTNVKVCFGCVITTMWAVLGLRWLERTA